MKKIILPTLILLCLCIFLAFKDKSIETQRAELQQKRAEIEARIQNLESEALRDEAMGLTKTVFWLLDQQIDDQIPPSETSYDENPFLWIDDYKNPSDMLANYINGIIAFTYNEYLLGDIDITMPFAYPFDNQFVWSDVTLADGTHIPISNSFDITPPDAHVYNGGTDISVVPSASGYTIDTPLPINLNGILKISAPKEMIHMELTKSDLGDAFEFGEYKIELNELKGHMALVKVKRLDGNIIMDDPIQLIIAAKDTTGQYLDSSGWSSGPSNAYLDEMLTILPDLIVAIENGAIEEGEVDANFEKRVKSLENKYGHEYYQQKMFQGNIDTLEIVFAGAPKMEDIAIELSIHEESDHDYDTPLKIRHIPVQSIAYDHSLDFIVANNPPIDLSPQDISDQIIISPVRGYEGYESNVYFTYPKQLASNLYMDFHLGFMTSDHDRYDFEESTITFYDASGEIIKGDLPYEFIIDRLEFETAGFPTPPVRATGQFNVNLMPDMTIKTYPANALPEGVKITDNMLIIEGNHKSKMFAIDNEGRPLQNFYSEIFHYSDINTPKQTVIYHYGNPSAILVVSEGETTSVPYNFDIDLSVAEDD